MLDSRLPASPADCREIAFIPPQRLCLGDRQMRVGFVVYRLLDALFRAPTHACSVAELETTVWGKPVNRNTLWSACRRARSVLVKLQHPLRVAIDGDRVTLV